MKTLIIVPRKGYVDAETWSEFRKGLVEDACPLVAAEGTALWDYGAHEDALILLTPWTARKARKRLYEHMLRFNIPFGFVFGRGRSSRPVHVASY